MNPTEQLLTRLANTLERLERRLERDDVDRLTVDALAARWGLDAETIRRHIRAGRLAAERVGKHFLVSRPAAAAFLRERRVRA